MSSEIKNLSFAVVGASGAVGEAMLDCLANSALAEARVVPVASARSAGESVSYRGRNLTIQDLTAFDFSGIDIALFSAGGSVSREYAPLAAAAGAIVIDNSSAFRQDPEVPLVIPEVNPDALTGFRKKGIIANPNCSTIQMLVGINPIAQQTKIERITVSTYQSVSGSGRKGMQALGEETARLLRFESLEASQAFPKQIAFNVIPHIDDFEDNGFTREEMKMRLETRKIFADSDIAVNATAVRVPVFYGHSEAVHLKTRDPLDVALVKSWLENAPGVTVVDDPKNLEYPTAVSHASGNDAVFVGRIRADLDDPHAINLWIVGDNIRKGAALNAVQIAENLVNSHL